MKKHDFSKKKVFRCDLCNSWFCDSHFIPKFPFFVDWDTIYDILGNPEIKAYFYTEYKKDGGHPDFIYLRKKIKELSIEESIKNKLARLAINKMVQNDKEKIDFAIDNSSEKRFENYFGHFYFAPIQVYKDKVYGERLRKANSQNQIDSIVRTYFKNKSIIHEKPKKKKHWWNRS